jgi:hypothetical protein
MEQQQIHGDLLEEILQGNRGFKMKNYKKFMIGEFLAQIVSDVTAIVYNSTRDKGRVVYDDNTGGLYYGNDGDNSFRPLNDIPKDTVVLFYHDTARLGYSLLTNIDDELVYISSGAGGANGAGGASFGTWTQPNHSHDLGNHTHTDAGSGHQHSLNSHTHTFASHNHKFLDYQGSGNMYGWASNGSTQILIQSYGSYKTSRGTPIIHVTGGDPKHAAGDFWTANSGSITSGAAAGSTSYDAPVTDSISTNTSGGNATSNTWRPTGNNVTRQQRQ